MTTSKFKVKLLCIQKLIYINNYHIGGIKMIEYRIYQNVYDDMISGKKNIEFRLLNENEFISLFYQMYGKEKVDSSKSLELNLK